MRPIIAKISGKIVENKENLDYVINQFKIVLEKVEIFNSIFIIPGGGSYANFIRGVEQNINLNNTIAHWEAIYAMEFNAKNILNSHKEINSIYHPNDFLKTQLENKKSNIFVFFPFDYLYQQDQLPHSWNVTSDSITVFIAHKIKVKQCFLIKNIDGIIANDGNVIRKIKAYELENLIVNNSLKKIVYQDMEFKKSQPIDSYILELIQLYGIKTIILNGSLKNSKILEFFMKSKKEYIPHTEVCP
jgi:hypothetical protein